MSSRCASGRRRLPDYFAGLDLGQAGDYTALAVAERHRDGAAPATYAVRHLRRWRLGTGYPQIVADCRALLAQPPLAPAGRLIVDQTGCGRPVFDMFAALGLGARLIGVTITAGTTLGEPAWRQYHVPKVDLIGQLQVLLQSQRLRIAARLPEAATLLHELEGYQCKITAAAHVQYGAWREGEHDDLLLAVALATWYAERPVVRWGAI
jgi:hypothetical protein